jgi:hypothetical protein
MMQIRESGTTVAIVSHNLNAVRKLCERTIVLNRGAVVYDGPTHGAISLYHELMGEHREIDDDDDGQPVNKGVTTIESFELCGADGRSTGHIRSGEDVTLRLEVRFDDDVVDPVFGFSIADERGINVYSESSLSKPSGSFRRGQRITYEMRMQARLARGSYRVEAGITAVDLRTTLARTQALSFFVSTGRMFGGLIDLGAEFSMNEVDEAPGLSEASSL